MATYRNNQETNSISENLNSTGMGNFSMATPTILNKTFLADKDRDKDLVDFED